MRIPRAKSSPANQPISNLSPERITELSDELWYFCAPNGVASKLQRRDKEYLHDLRKRLLAHTATIGEVQRAILEANRIQEHLERIEKIAGKDPRCATVWLRPIESSVQLDPLAQEVMRKIKSVRMSHPNHAPKILDALLDRLRGSDTGPRETIAIWRAAQRAWRTSELARRALLVRTDLERASQEYWADIFYVGDDALTSQVLGKQSTSCKLWHYPPALRYLHPDIAHRLNVAANLFALKQVLLNFNLLESSSDASAIDSAILMTSGVMTPNLATERASRTPPWESAPTWMTGAPDCPRISLCEDMADLEEPLWPTPVGESIVLRLGLWLASRLYTNLIEQRQTLCHTRADSIAEEIAKCVSSFRLAAVPSDFELRDDWQPGIPGMIPYLSVRGWGIQHEPDYIWSIPRHHAPSE